MRQNLATGKGSDEGREIPESSEMTLFQDQHFHSAKFPRRFLGKLDLGEGGGPLGMPLERIFRVFCGACIYASWARTRSLWD